MVSSAVAVASVDGDVADPVAVDAVDVVDAGG
jgi:hypothetical protein